MDWFWSYETEITENVGFSMWGTAHIVWLCILLTAGGGLGIWFVRQPYKRQLRVQVWLSVAMLSVEAVQDVFLAVGGHLTVYQLPLHLCGLALFITAAKNLLALCKGRLARMCVRYLADVQYALCLPGALAALLFPDWTVYPAVSFMSIVGFVNHGLLVASGCYAILDKHFTIHIKNLWRPVSFLAVLVPVMYAFDRRYNANYLFLLWASPGSPLVAVERICSPHYLVGYAGVVLVVMVVWYGVGMAATYLKRQP